VTDFTLSPLVILAAYLIGAVPFGYLIARWRGVDILHQGSGNIGATNVGRVLGKGFGILVFVLDFLKGAAPTFVADVLANRPEYEVQALGHYGLPVLAGLAAFLGHLFPIYLRFKGGKGVATGAGVVTVLLPVPMVGALITWVAVVFITNYVSLASLGAVVALCLLQLTIVPEPFSGEQRTLTYFCFVAAALVVVKHRSNIVRLYQGKENRIRGVSAMSTLARTVHVLALGLWFGSAVFFNFVVAPALFQKFEALGADPQAIERAWLPLTSDFNKEQGTRLAGVAVSPLFPWYFLLEGVCGLAVALTALAWARALPQERIHRIRSLLALLALATVVIGWPLAQHVSALRYARYQGDEAAKAAFGAWHGYSLLLSLVTVVLVTVLMALAARLPEAEVRKPEVAESDREADAAASPRESEVGS
jgi:acyl-phosphate glycerol 3-phosphate acyltransferase